MGWGYFLEVDFLGVGRADLAGRADDLVGWDLVDWDLVDWDSVDWGAGSGWGAVAAKACSMAASAIWSAAARAASSAA